MGCCYSKHHVAKGRMSYDQSRAPGLCVVEIIQAEHLPNMDTITLTDAYVLCKFADTSNPLLHNYGVTRTLTRYNNLDPQFHAYIAFPFVPNNSDLLTLEVFHENIAQKDNRIGSVAVTFEDLKSSKGPITINLKMDASDKSVDGLDPTITVRLVEFGTVRVPSIRKNIFIIRHGESKWNEGKADKNIKGMLSQYDHELTNLGIDQATNFNAAWKSACYDAGLSLDSQQCSGTENHSGNNDTKSSEMSVGATDLGSDIATFLSAQAIFSSPLTRAIQTALLTCEDHPLLRDPSSPGLTLLRTLREVKCIGCFDTVGRFTGDDIPQHIHSLLCADLGEERADKIMAAPIDVRDAVGPWWTPLEDTDSPEAVQKRFNDLWTRLRFGTKADTIILVGHSTFFRDLLRQYMSNQFRESQPEWCYTLEECKLANGACLRLTVEWTCITSPADPPLIHDVKLVFGSKLKRGHKQSGVFDLETFSPEDDEGPFRGPVDV